MLRSWFVLVLLACCWGVDLSMQRGKEPCLPAVNGSGSILGLWERLQLNTPHDLQRGRGATVVNLGAKWIDNKANVDISWAVVQGASPPVRVIAFDPQQADKTSRMVTSRLTSAQAAKVTIVNEYAYPTTIAHVLHNAYLVPREPARFALLKIDVDSVDGALASAILKEFSPALVYAEFSMWTPVPLRFSALAPKKGRNASFFRNYRGFNNVWPCGGTSLAMWASIASERGYQIVSTDKHSNVLLVHNSLNHRLALEQCDVLKKSAKYANKEATRRLVGGRTNTHMLHSNDLAAATAIIERRCKENDTPYTLHTEDRCLCPPMQTKEDALCHCNELGMDIWQAEY